jgi:DNA processing protein
MTNPERSACISLALTPGIGASRLGALLSRFGSAERVLAASFDDLRAVRGISPAAATAIEERTAADGEKVLAQARALGGECLLPSEPGFPEVFREIPDPPTLLFALGDLACLARPAVAIVGSRDHSPYGAEACRSIAGAAAAAGIAVVSGMARGLDAIAHAAALDAGGTTIGVLGNGLGVIYPAANRALYRAVAERGLLLTEFPPGERPGPGSFPRRNRLISGLARVTVVVEAAEGSGALITVGAALAQGRDVMVVPGNITSPTSVGANGLIRDGAEPLLTVEDLLAHFPEADGSAARRHDFGGSATRRLGGSVMETMPRRPPEGLTPLEAAIFESVSAGPEGLDAIVGRTGSPASETLAAISTMEVKGLVTQVNGLVTLAVPGA